MELRIEGERALTGFPAVFTEIHKGNARIVATVRLFPGAASVAQRGYPADFIWEVEARQPFHGLLPAGAEAISFAPDEESVAHLPDVLEEFADTGVRALHLRNVNAMRSLDKVGHVPVPRLTQLQEAAESVARRLPPLDGRKLVIFDHIFWRSLRAVLPEEKRETIEFSACEAASAHAYVDWEGNVYPCDSLPIRLGNLQDTAFETIWRSPARIQVFDAIRDAPASCEGCGFLESCLSGCRGLAYSTSA